MIRYFSTAAGGTRGPRSRRGRTSRRRRGRPRGARARPHRARLDPARQRPRVLPRRRRAADGTLTELREQGTELRILPLGAREEQRRFFERIVGPGSSSSSATRSGRPGEAARTASGSPRRTRRGPSSRSRCAHAAARANERLCGRLRLPPRAGAQMTRRRLLAAGRCCRSRSPRRSRSSRSTSCAGATRWKPRTSASSARPRRLVHGAAEPPSVRRRGARARRERRPRVPATASVVRARPAARRVQRTAARASYGDAARPGAARAAAIPTRAAARAPRT